MSAPEFTLFVSSVPNRTVYRFGTRVLIGAKRVYDPPLQPNEDIATRERVTTWQPERIFPIPKAEAERYGAEYRGALADGALKERTREEWEAQNQKDFAAEKAAAEQAKKAAKANTP